jgi:arylsulfatase A-like enzyme
MIYSVDESVGRVMKTLDEMGVADNTVVFFTADNGGVSSREWKQRQVTSNAPLRLGKGHLYEGGIRVPTLVRWPGVTKPGSVCEDPIYTCDYYPTIAEIAGAPLESSHKPDGTSIVGALRGQRMAERSMYWHYPHYSPQLGRPSSALRRGDWKLIEHLETNTAELYNLKSDIGERKDLAGAETKRLTAMRNELHAWRTKVDAQMPAQNPDYDPAQEPKPAVEPVA